MCSDSLIYRYFTPEKIFRETQKFEKICLEQKGRSHISEISVFENNVERL